MLTNPRKKYSWIMALSLLGVINTTPSLAAPQGTNANLSTRSPSTPEQIRPRTSNLESILRGPAVSRRISECYDNGLC
ncbi:hypothetical protein [Planktothrix serta]|uniref:hypothetical protein n=1 Tax=Planktothrix serta TaxID=1678310 RepID=UPI0012DE32C4|nr:hypothetical protein [Planktothrix serta]